MSLHVCPLVIYAPSAAAVYPLTVFGNCYWTRVGDGRGWSPLLLIFWATDAKRCRMCQVGAADSGSHVTKTMILIDLLVLGAEVSLLPQNNKIRLLSNRWSQQQQIRFKRCPFPLFKSVHTVDKYYRFKITRLTPKRLHLVNFVL